MPTIEYQEISAQEASNLEDEDIKIVIENTSLTKFKTIQIASETPIKNSEDNLNDSIIIEENYLQVCLQPFTINCEGAPFTSETFIYNTSHTYRITLNGVTSIVRGADLNDFFSQNNISMMEIVEAT